MHIPLRNVDMIQGKPWRQILRFSLPLILGNILQQMIISRA